MAELGDQIYQDPASGKHVLKDDYLSGNVKAKLASAQAMAKTDPAYHRNVRALKEVIPDDLPVSAIPVNLGAMWVPESVVHKFAEEVLGIRLSEVHKFQRGEKSEWTVKKRYDRKSEFDTSRRKAHQILEATLNQRAIVVRDKLDKDTSVINDKETAAANQKQQEMKA